MPVRVEVSSRIVIEKCLVSTFRSFLSIRIPTLSNQSTSSAEVIAISVTAIEQDVSSIVSFGQLSIECLLLSLSSPLCNLSIVYINSSECEVVTSIVNVRPAQHPTCAVSTSTFVTLGSDPECSSVTCSRSRKLQSNGFFTKSIVMIVSHCALNVQASEQVLQVD